MSKTRGAGYRAQSVLIYGDTAFSDRKEFDIIGPSGTVIASCRAKCSANLIVDALNTHRNVKESRRTMKKVVS